MVKALENVEVICKVCNETKTITMSSEQYKRVEKGNEHIQNILPNHTADERELLISGICETCWDKYFGEEEWQ